MSEWKAKRFWETVEVVPSQAGYEIALDTRRVKTPAKRSLSVPSRGYADAIAAEWEAQKDQIDPQSMPYTRMANAALDKVALQHAEVADLLAAYGDSDLLCYRAERPAELVMRQAQNWDPFLDWAATAMETRLEARAGVMHIPQDAAVLARLSKRVHALNAFQLAAFHDLVSLSGSLILGFAATQDVRSAEAIWDISRLDEFWQAEQWGIDAEAEAAAAVKQAAFEHAKVIFDLSKPDF